MSDPSAAQPVLPPLPLTVDPLTVPTTTSTQQAPLTSEKPVADPFGLNIFLFFQNGRDKEHSMTLYNRAMEVIRGGASFRTLCPKLLSCHSKDWVQWVFPQMDHCNTSYRDCEDNGTRHPIDYILRPHALTTLNSARAYLAHPILGSRIRLIAQALVESSHADKFGLTFGEFKAVERIRSSLTIFRQAVTYPVCIHDRVKTKGKDRVFRQALDKYFAPVPDSDDECYDSGEEDLIKTRRGVRHAATVARLNTMELEDIEKRLALPEKEATCACGRTGEELLAVDRAAQQALLAWQEKKKLEQ